MTALQVKQIENRLWSVDEVMPRPELRQLQVARLKELMARVAHVPFYKEQFARLHVTPESIKSLDDLRRLPITTKDDLRQSYPYGMFAVPREKLVRIPSNLTSEPQTSASGDNP